MTTKPTVGYWNIRGLGQPIRYLLRYVGIQFIDKRYQFEPKEEWLSDKTSLGLDFPNIPYYIDGDIKLTQSLAILRYLAQKHGLVAIDDQTFGRQVMAEQQILDLRDSLANIIMSPDFEAKRDDYNRDKVVPQLELLIKFLGNNQWLTGSLSYVDFLSYEVLDWIRLFVPETVNKYPVIIKYLTCFEELPAIKAYRESDEYKSWPLFGPSVKWGYNK